jgi:DNA-directed RNA polymerase specialized sigma24 family protein
MEALKSEQRDVVVLRLILGLSTREVGQMLGKSEAAIHSLQVRATRALRKRLEENSA